MDRQRNNRGGRQDRPVEEKQFEERVVHVNRVARVVKGGRRFRFQALVVVGDKKGRVGVGVSKGADVTTAVTKAVEVAKRNFLSVSMHQKTITHDVDAKVGGAKIVIMPAAPGTGIIAGGVVRAVLEVAGIENALSKSLGASNKINLAYATIEALSKCVPAKQWVTRQTVATNKPAKKTTKSTEKVAA